MPPLLSYADIIGMNYIPAEAGIVLSAAEQTLAVQAVACFGFSELWADYDTNADAIEALVASTLNSLLETTIPPKENMNNRILLSPIMGDITSGNAFTFFTVGYYSQNAPAVNNAYNYQNITLAAGHWKIYGYGFKQNNAGILRIDVKDQSGTTIDADSEDLYSAATIKVPGYEISDFTLAADTTVDLFISTTTKNASSSSYFLPVSYYELIRVP